MGSNESLREIIADQQEYYVFTPDELTPDHVRSGVNFTAEELSPLAGQRLVVTQLMYEKHMLSDILVYEGHEMLKRDIPVDQPIVEIRFVDIVKALRAAGKREAAEWWLGNAKALRSTNNMHGPAGPTLDFLVANGELEISLPTEPLESSNR